MRHLIWSKQSRSSETRFRNGARSEAWMWVELRVSCKLRVVALVVLMTMRVGMLMMGFRVVVSRT